GCRIRNRGGEGKMPSPTAGETLALPVRRGATTISLGIANGVTPAVPNNRLLTTARMLNAALRGKVGRTGRVPGGWSMRCGGGENGQQSVSFGARDVDYGLVG